MAIEGPLKVSLQLLGGSEPAIGPGKALVLEAIDRTGSISAAGRDLAMSYRRIWLLVDGLNRSWKHRVVETRDGEGSRRGARLTPFGQEMLARYRAVERRMLDAARTDDLAWLLAAIDDRPVENRLRPGMRQAAVGG